MAHPGRGISKHSHLFSSPDTKGKALEDRVKIFTVLDDQLVDSNLAARRPV